MKRIIFYLSAIMLLISCSSVKETERQTIFLGYDFTPYTDKGFLFTPFLYNDNYESIALLTVEMYPEIKKQHVKSAFDSESTKIVIEEINTNEVINRLGLEKVSIISR